MNNTFIKILNNFEEKNVLTVIELELVFQISTVVVVVVFFFQKYFFFLTRSLIDRCQIVTDACKKRVRKFLCKPFESLLSLHK